MSSSRGFAGKWTARHQPGVRDHLREQLGPHPPLRATLDSTHRALEAQIARLDGKSKHLRDKDTHLFRQVTESVQRHDTQQASAFSNELAEVRKMQRMVTQSQLIMEQIQLRLSTTRELGDLVVTLGPVLPVVKDLRRSLGGVMPEAGREIEEIGSMLSGLVTDAGRLTGLPLTFDTTSEDAERILAEAAAIAERRTKQSLPDLPGVASDFPQQT